MLSNCYCAPVSISAPEAKVEMQKMASHCSHDAAKAKECAPRFQSDQFEKMDTQIRFDSKVSAPLLLMMDEPLASGFVVSSRFDFSPVRLASPPPQFLLHHAFLI